MVYTGITKNQAFRVLFCSEVASTDTLGNYYCPTNQAAVDDSVIEISKDGGPFIAATNAGVYIRPGIFTVLLTSAEMNADSIYISVAGLATPGKTSKFSSTAAIFTGSSSGGGASAADVWNYTTRALTTEVTVDTTSLLAKIQKLFLIFK